MPERRMSAMGPSPERFEADYLIETACDLREAADAMAGEQSSGTFVSVPGETAELKERAAAKVIRLDVLGEVPRPSLPGARPPVGSSAVIRRATVTLSWPLDNIGSSLPNLLATVAGNLFELQQLSGLRLEALRLPRAFAGIYPGPRFGIDGTRKLTGVTAGPIIGTIIKPSIGLSAEDTANLVTLLCDAGIDFIKDDELQTDGVVCPFEDRARAVMSVISRHADRTGKKVMYAFNLTGDLDQMRRRHDLIASLGGTCVMASLNSVGMVGIIELARHSQLPIHAHRNGWGYLSRDPMLGWNYVAWQKLWRIAGVDHMHVNGLRSKFSEADASVVASARECLRPIWPDKPCIVMPVFSSGQTALQIPDTVTALQSGDFIYAAGGGILAHPDGARHGVESLRQAFDAAQHGIPLAEYARSHRALAQALEAYEK
jgi:3-oxoisoapionate-4-phosphate transcarboxylase/hydrolase